MAHIEFPYPDMARFDPKKYDNVLGRLAWWGMPFGHAVTKGTLPFGTCVWGAGVAPNPLVESFRAVAKCARIAFTSFNCCC